MLYQVSSGLVKLDQVRSGYIWYVTFFRLGLVSSFYVRLVQARSV